jgi:C4-dicarboxylate-specific signal transduction histidine kinase
MRSRATRAPDDDGRAGSAVPAASEGQAAGSGLNDAQRYGHLFRFMPIPLLQLDRGELADVFDALRAEGVADLHGHIDKNPGFLEYALNSIKIREVNQRTVDLFEANDANRLIGPVKRLWSENPDIFRQSLEARYHGAVRYEAEIQIRTFDDMLRQVLYVTDFPEAFCHEPLGLACLIDISDRVRAHEMLRQVQAEFAHAGRVSLLGELTASIAHEVNQPLAAIVTSGEASLRWLSQPDPDIGELKALVSRTVADARRAADILRRIHDMAAPTAPQQAPTQLNGVVQEVLLFLRHELQRQGVTATVDFAPDLPDVVVDRVQLQQVIVNLAVNAMQAMAEAGTKDRRIAIRTVREDRMVRVDVDDSGPGILQVHLGRIFDSFVTTKSGGIGIGLTICRSIIEAHGGRIHAANSHDHVGARITFRLPSTDLPQASDA